MIIITIIKLYTKKTIVEKKKEKKKGERVELLEEILESEKAYVNSLVILVTHFLQPLETANKEGNEILPPVICQGIFSNVAQLMSLNVELLGVMELELINSSTKKRIQPRRCSTSSMNSTGTLEGEDLSRAITKGFKELVPYFKMYSWYVNNYVHAVELLKEEKSKNQKFSKFLIDCESHEICRGLDLGAYLIMPVQRLCKYPLLFGRLLKLSTNKFDYDNIEQVSKVVNDITQAVDLDRNRAELSLRGYELVSILSLENIKKASPSGTVLYLVEPGRRFLYEFDSMLLRTIQSGSKKNGNTGEIKPRTVFIFNNLFVVAKKGNKGYDARMWIPLENNSLILGDISPILSETSNNSRDDQNKTKTNFIHGVSTNMNSLDNKNSPSNEKNLTAKGSGRWKKNTSLIKKNSEESIYNFNIMVGDGSGFTAGGRFSSALLGRTRNKRLSERLTFFFKNEKDLQSAYIQIKAALTGKCYENDMESKLSSLDQIQLQIEQNRDQQNNDLKFFENLDSSEYDSNQALTSNNRSQSSSSEPGCKRNEQKHKKKIHPPAPRPKAPIKTPKKVIHHRSHRPPAPTLGSKCNSEPPIRKNVRPKAPMLKNKEKQTIQTRNSESALNLFSNKPVRIHAPMVTTILSDDDDSLPSPKTEVEKWFGDT